MSGRQESVVAAVREMEGAALETALLAVGTTSRKLMAYLEVTESTALRYLRETIAAGHLVEVAHAGRRLLLPWPEGMTNPPDVWVTGAVNRGKFRMTEHREVGPAMAKIRFVMTPERLKQLMDRVLAEQEAKAAKEKEERDAYEAARVKEDAEERAAFARHYPFLAEMLARFHEQVHVPGKTARGVGCYVTEHSEGRVRGRVQIEVGDERFEVLEKILSDGLG